MPNIQSPMVSSQTAASSPASPPRLDKSGSLLSSPIGKKLLTGITGLGLVTFVIVHVLGNLTLFVSADTYNQLAHSIEQLGPLLWVIEGVLLAMVIVHATIGITIYLGKQKARQGTYAQYESAGEPSRQTLASRTMIFSGVLLGLFLVGHLATFKFGPVYALPGSGERDLARLVFETFHRPAYTAGYVLILSFLGLHLRHGLWSALQSLGVATKPGVFAASAVIGGAIALSFIGLPLSIYFGLIG